MKVLMLLLATAIFASGCAAAGPQSRYTITGVKPVLSEDKKALRASFVGRWLSKQPTKEGGTRETIIDRFDDSKYLVEFKSYDAEGALIGTQQEFGVWGVSSGIYFTMYRGWVENGHFYPADPTDAYNYDSYKILEVSLEQLEYVSLSSGNRFIYLRAE